MLNSDQSLPIISLAPFLSHPAQSPESRSAANALAEACEEHGFFYLTDHGILQSQLDEILDLARRFFLEAPAEEKSRLQRLDTGQTSSDGRKGDGARGYQQLGENVTQGARDHHEALDWYREVESDREIRSSKLLSDGTLCGVNPWPNFPSEFEPTYKNYIKKVLEVGAQVVRAMGLALRLTEDEMVQFEKATNQSFWVMRAIGYPPLRHNSHNKTVPNTENDEGISCGAHTDYGCLTLLLADPTPGSLQVLSKASTPEYPQWIPANPVPGAFVVNIGDMVEKWTNGLWKSTLHRVVHTSSNFRVSVPFFFEPNWDVLVSPFATCVKATGEGKKHDSVMYGEHLIGKIKGNFYGGSSDVQDD